MLFYNINNIYIDFCYLFYQYLSIIVNNFNYFTIKTPKKYFFNKNNLLFLKKNSNLEKILLKNYIKYIF